MTHQWWLLILITSTQVLTAEFVGPLALLKVAIGTMKPDPTNGRRCTIVIISGISSAQVMGNYASSKVSRCAWLAEAKTLAFDFSTSVWTVSTPCTKSK